MASYNPRSIPLVQTNSQLITFERDLFTRAYGARIEIDTMSADRLNRQEFEEYLVNDRVAAVAKQLHDLMMKEYDDRNNTPKGVMVET